ncbi:MAG: TOBE domain-containing protein, partial [Lachnospiraceae bacterium]|nr:TOBE domain-containing protein [Lachnospiraceae bacterium]
LLKKGGRYVVDLAGYQVEVDDEKQARLTANAVPEQEITLGIRPEHTNIVPEGIKAKVDVSEMMGSSVHLHVSAEGRDVIIIVPTVDMKENFRMGDQIQFGFGGSVVHMFSKDTEKNLEF